MHMRDHLKHSLANLLDFFPAFIEVGEKIIQIKKSWFQGFATVHF